MNLPRLFAAALVLCAQPVLAQSGNDDDMLKAIFPVIHCQAVVAVTADFLEAAKPEDTKTAAYMRKKLADSRALMTVMIKPNKFDAAVYLETQRLRGPDFDGSLKDKMDAYDGVEAEYSKCLQALSE
jgi:hypothetical protein